MDFELSQESQSLKELANRFAREKMEPFAGAWDKDHRFPVDVLKEAASLGFGGITAREDIGGSNLGRLNAAIIFEALSTGCISTSAYLSIHNMVTSLIDNYADESLRSLWGPRLTSMQVLASYCLTEPESGSDAASLKTTAVLDGDDYIVNGSKAFISGGSVSELYLSMVRTGEEGHKGISCLLIEKDRPGLSFGKLENKLGWRNQPTCMIFFDNCRVPASNLVGKEGMGFKIALHALNGGRVNIAACSLGGAKSCLRLSQNYLDERKQFGEKLSTFQGLRFYFSDMMVQFEAAKLMVYRAAEALDRKDEKSALYCAMAKQLATDSSFKIADKAMQLHGGYGYLQEYQIERIFRDLRAHQILEGSNEIMREIIAKSVLEKSYFID